MGIFSKQQEKPTTVIKPAMALTAMPPNVITKIISFLPVPDLSKIARASRRLKILAYNDDVYIPKLIALGAINPTLSKQPSSSPIIDSATALSPSSINEAEAAVTRLSTKLKQLPGGNMLPNNSNYLETGTLWSGLASETLASDEVTDSESASNPSDPCVEITVTSSPDTVSSQTDEVVSPAQSDGSTDSNATAVSTRASSSMASSPQKISVPLPHQMSKSNIVIGAGGLKAAAKNQAGLGLSVGAGRVSRTLSPQLDSSIKPRDVFKEVYSELLPYYKDFQDRQRDSKLFRDYTDLSDIAIVLRRLKLFADAKFIPGKEDLNLSLETTTQWFESMVLGQFDRAYDAKNYAEMRKNANACYELNGGLACVQLFISKNPIFYDETYNPSLVASKLPSSSSSDAKGYALSDEFANFMDHVLNRCKEQAELVSKVFNPEMNAMTSFVAKVFDDSITEYLAAVMKTAKDRETLGIYLHTFATAVYCCSQFLDFIQNAVPGVVVHTDKIRKNIAHLFKPYYEKYLTMEVEYMNKRFDTEISKWKNKDTKRRMSTKAPEASAAGYFTDAEKAQAHKRHVMSTFKAVLFAPVAIPVAIGRGIVTVGGSLFGARPSTLKKNVKNAKSKSNDDEDSDSSSEGMATYHLDDNALGSLVSLQLCLSLIHTNKEALGRVLVITATVDSTQIRDNVGKVFIQILQALAGKHIAPAFKLAIERIGNSKPMDSWTDSQESVNIDSLQFFELIHVADLVHQMVDSYFAEDIKPWIDDQDFLSDVMTEKKSFDRLSDNNVATGMDKAIQALVLQADHLLVNSLSESYYNPPVDKQVLDLRPTPVCQKVIECLSAHTKLFTGATSKDTIEVFFGEVGIRLFNVILKNLKKSQVSQTGAMQLMCDMNRYHEWACSLRVSSVSKLFCVLKEVASLYLAEGGNDLKNLVHDQSRYQGMLRPEEIYELLAARTDYKKIQKYVESKECVIQ